MVRMVKAHSKAVALSVAISLAGCSTTATIHRVNGPAYEAKIVQSDSTSLDVLGDDGQPYRVPREQVSEIDHPGNVLATIGAALVGFAGLITWAVATDNSQSQSGRRSAAIAVGTVYGLPGLLMAVAGGSIWMSSKDKARALEETPLPIARMPPERPAYAPPWVPPWPPAAPAPLVSKPPLQLEAEPIPARAAPPAAAPQSDPPSFRPAPPAPTPEPAP